MTPSWHQYTNMNFQKGHGGEGVHTDFVGSFEGQQFLVTVEALSKWPVVEDTSMDKHCMNTIM